MSATTNDTMEKLRVYKQVCLKIRSTLVSGREDLVSPTLVTRNFVEGFASSLNDRLLSEQAMNRGDTSVYGLANSHGNGASANCAAESRPVCPFIEPAEGWTIEYSETTCDVSKISKTKRQGLSVFMIFVEVSGPHYIFIQTLGQYLCSSAVTSMHCTVTLYVYDEFLILFVLVLFMCLCVLARSSLLASPSIIIKDTCCCLHTELCTALQQMHRSTSPLL